MPARFQDDTPPTLAMLKKIRFAPVALSFLVLFTSCFLGARPPEVTPTRTLAMEGEGGDTASKKPFDVVFASPKGATVDPSEVTIVFNRPMRPLDLAGEESSPPAKITESGGQPVKGSWRWIGTNALIFAAPQEGLPRATEYAVSVPAGTKALNGETMAKAFEFSFHTPAPKIVRIDPEEGEEHLAPNAHFDLRFNQAVDPKEVARAVHLRVDDGKKERTIAVTASWPKADTKMLVTAKPSSPLPYDSAVTLVVDESLHGMEGPMPLGEKREIAMRTFGPLVSKGMDCYRDTPNKKCAARDSVWAKMSNRVSFKEWKAHVTIDSGAKIAWDSWAGENDANMTETMTLPSKLLAGHGYHLKISAGMKDEYGQKLAHDVSIPFDTDDEWPEVEVGLSGSIFEAPVGKAKKRTVPIGSVNVASYDMATAAPSEAELARFLSRDRDRKEDSIAIVAEQPHGKKERVTALAAKNAQFVKKLDLDDTLKDQGGRGTVVFAVQQFNRYGGPHADVHVVSVTDLAISAKMSRFGSLVWVTRLSDGKPVAGAHVGIRAGDGAEVFAAATNA
ncbi:MAG: Ig-like domain-containing protein, partial [Polyangiaceae bacterium]